MSNGIKVTKRSGQIEPLDLDKMHLMVEEATVGLAGVSATGGNDFWYSVLMMAFQLRRSKKF